MKFQNVLQTLVKVLNNPSYHWTTTAVFFEAPRYHTTTCHNLAFKPLVRNKVACIIW